MKYLGNKVNEINIYFYTRHGFLLLITIMENPPKVSLTLVYIINLNSTEEMLG